MTQAPLSLSLSPNWSSDRHRSRRVVVLLAAIIVLSVADLVVTLTHLRSIGMIEANPIAAFIIRQSSSMWPLVVYKLSTVAVCVGMLFHLRTKRSGEVAAWVAVGILVALSLQWHAYTQQLDEPDPLWLAQASTRTADWLVLD